MNAKTTTYLAVILMAAGFLLIVLGWNGAASKDFVTGQLPYVISGGFAGVSLVLAGVALTLVHELRRSTAMLSQRLDQVVAALEVEVADPGGASNLPEPRIRRDVEDEAGTDGEATDPADDQQPAMA